MKMCQSRWALAVRCLTLISEQKKKCVELDPPTMTRLTTPTFPPSLPSIQRRFTIRRTILALKKKRSQMHPTTPPLLRKTPSQTNQRGVKVQISRCFRQQESEIPWSDSRPSSKPPFTKTTIIQKVSMRILNNCLKLKTHWTSSALFARLSKSPLSSTPSRSSNGSLLSLSSVLACGQLPLCPSCSKVWALLHTCAATAKRN